MAVFLTMPAHEPIKESVNEVVQKAVYTTVSQGYEQGFPVELSFMDKSDPLFWLYQRAEEEFAKRVFDKATPIYEKMLELGRGRKEIQLFVHLRLAKIYALERRFSKLKKHFLSAIAMEPENARLRFELGQALTEIGKLREAVNAFRCAVERDPEVSTYHMHYAMSLSKLGSFQPAEIAFRRALGKDSEKC